MKEQPITPEEGLVDLNQELKPSMKKYWIIALVIVGFGIAASAVMWIRQPAPRPGDWLAKELNLTPGQQTQVAALDKDFNGKCTTYCDAMCTARFAMAEELQHAEGITPKVEELLLKMQAAQAANEREALENLFRIKSVLTEEQRLRYVELISGKLCGMCPQGAHHHDHHP